MELAKGIPQHKTLGDFRPLRTDFAGYGVAPDR